MTVWENRSRMISGLASASLNLRRCECLTISGWLGVRPFLFTNAIQFGLLYEVGHEIWKLSTTIGTRYILRFLKTWGYVPLDFVFTQSRPHYPFGRRIRAVEANFLCYSKSVYGSSKGLRDGIWHCVLVPNHSLLLGAISDLKRLATTARISPRQMFTNRYAWLTWNYSNRVT